jgi:predicted ATPase
MIRLIEALNFRCLRYVRQPLGAFHVLVGPNASGKSSFLDVLAFLSRLIGEGLEAAVAERTQSFQDLVWGRERGRLEMAVEAEIPDECVVHPSAPRLGAIRYAVALGIQGGANQLRVLDEQLLLLRSDGNGSISKDSVNPSLRRSLIRESEYEDSLPIASTKRSDYRLIPERPREQVPPHAPVMGAGHERLARREVGQTVFRTLNTEEFPAATWLEQFLVHEVHSVNLDSKVLHRPSPPGLGVMLHKDGANLPWVVTQLKRKDRSRFRDWVRHLRTALPDLDTVRVLEQPENKHRYLMLRYRNGLEVPAWMLSEGTLRLLALTLIAYVPDIRGIWLIEEPETSVHPLNIEPILQSLQSVYDGQVLMATQSPAVLAMVGASDVLVLSRDERLGTHIVKGSEHSDLAHWKGQPDLSVLFASGVLS